MLRSKIHRATVTDTMLDYEGSIAIDEDLLDKAGIWVGEKVSVANVSNGARFDTYVFGGGRGTGTVTLNGAAARLCAKGDRIIIMGYELTAEPIHAKVILVDENNRAVRELLY
ncbi:MAG: aspartate 1-decarboxylase [Candidatus Methanoplasma sp.]|jgi:aspartate 1-decarboxylase|nr:aspartate 1-decarboxylase [Candidatus Methanoplasma sp.]